MEKIIIFFHIYYIDLLDEYLWYLNNIKTSKYKFDLYVSLCEETKNDITIDKLKEFDSNVIITLCENKGADSGGFFTSLRNNTINFDSYISVLYLHTKSGLSYGKIESLLWRGELLNDILINNTLIEFCINKIKNGSGIIGSSRCISDIDNSLTVYKIEKINYDLLCKTLNMTHQEKSLFVSGTIFWAHPNIFKFIQQSSITINNFTKGFSHNSMLEHSIERLFGNISLYLKLNVYGIKLDINNNMYHKSFNLFNIPDNINIYTFKIDTKIILPNESIIQHLLKIKKKLHINNIYK